MSTISAADFTSDLTAGHEPASRACSGMHRIHVSTVVALFLGVILTLVVALQMLPATGTADAAAPTRAWVVELLPLPIFIVCAALAVLASAALLVRGSAERSSS